VAPHQPARLALTGVAINAALFILVLFVPAWTLDWWRAWAIVAIVVAGTAGSTIALIALLLSFLGYLIFTSLDATHLHVLPPPPGWLSFAGLLATIAGWALAWRALRENAFAAPVVKLQEDRQQHVVETGPYRYVRHPLYAGGALLILGIPLWLQSTAGTLAALVPIAVLVIRIMLEERFLRRELAGYAGYAQRTRYRLIPLIW
jgi:protein-S-isoprenylcysteine O-methyltransferase Ste14